MTHRANPHNRHRGAVSVSPLGHSPAVDALAQFAPAEAAHLLARVAFATRQHADLFADEAAVFGDGAENQVHGHFLPVVLHVVVDHHDIPSGSRDPCEFGDHHSHLGEVIRHQANDVGIAELRPACGQRVQHFGEGLLRGDCRVGLGEYVPPCVAAFKLLSLGTVLDGGADERLSQIPERGAVVAQPRQFQRVGAGVVVPIRIRRRGDRQVH